MSSPKQSFASSNTLAQKRKAQGVRPSRNKLSTGASKNIPNCTPENCIFCNQKNHQSKKEYFPSMINKALYSKYSSSQNYYFTRDINEILANTRTAFVIKYKDFVTWDEEEEYLKRFYKSSEYQYKVGMLTEYYKFHNDISRLFMMPTTNILNKYHDKKRRLEYLRVTNMLREENEKKNPSPKPKEKPRHEEKEKAFVIERILENLEISNTYHDQAETFNKVDKGANNPTLINKNSSQKPANGRFDLQRVVNSNTNQGQSNNFIPRYKESRKEGRNEQDAHLDLNPINQSKNHSISHTIQDLNLKLGEIIANNSRNYGNYFDTMTGATLNNQTNTNDPFLNETISNLSNFLNFLKNSAQQHKINEIPEIVGSNPLQQVIAGSVTSRKSDSDNLKLAQQINIPSRANSQSPAELLTPSTSNLARKLYPSSTATAPVQRNNYIISEKNSDTKSPLIKENKHELERPANLASVSKFQTKSTANLESKIKNFDEMLKQTDQNTGFKIHSTQTSQRSISRESKRASLTNQNSNFSGKNSLSKTPHNFESGSREPSISKSPNFENAATKAELLTKSASKSHIRQADSITRSNLGSTQSSMKSATKFESSPSVASQNNFLNLGKSTYLGTANTQSEKLLKKSHARINSENVGILTKNNGVRVQPSLSAALKISLPLSTQNLLAQSSSNFYQNGNINPQTVRDILSYDTYEQFKQPQSLKGSLSRRNLQSTREIGGANTNLADANKIAAVEALAQNYGDRNAFDGINSARPISIHKYTKSESKYNKLEFQKVSEGETRGQDPLSYRKLFQEDGQGTSQQTTSKLSYGGPTAQNASPNKQIYTYNQNNIVNIYLQDSQKDPNIAIKAETERFGSKTGKLAFGQQSYPFSSKSIMKKLSSPNETNGMNNQLNSQRAVLSTEAKLGSYHASPVKASKKEDLVTAFRPQHLGTFSAMSTTATNFSKKNSKKQF